MKAIPLICMLGSWLNKKYKQKTQQLSFSQICWEWTFISAIRESNGLVNLKDSFGIIIRFLSILTLAYSFYTLFNIPRDKKSSTAEEERLSCQQLQNLFATPAFTVCRHFSWHLPTSWCCEEELHGWLQLWHSCCRGGTPHRPEKQWKITMGSPLNPCSSGALDILHWKRLISL